jgi:hypothetical protein
MKRTNQFIFSVFIITLTAFAHGDWGPRTYTYRDCKPGQGNIKQGNGKSYSCVACAPGMYSEGGKVECMKCPKTRDQKLGQVGAKNITECICNHGYGVFVKRGSNPKTLIPLSAKTQKDIQEMQSGSFSVQDGELTNALHKCTKCPFGTYSRHTESPHVSEPNTCFVCPQNRPMTEKDGQSSITSCKRTGEKAEGCLAGYGVRYIK